MGLFRQFTKDEAKVLRKMAADKDKVKSAREVTVVVESPKQEEKQPARNYKSEATWSAEKYKQFNVKIEKEKGELFASALKENGDTLLAWFTRNMELYMQELKKAD